MFFVQEYTDNHSLDKVTALTVLNVEERLFLTYVIEIGNPSARIHQKVQKTWMFI